MKICGLVLILLFFCFDVYAENYIEKLTLQKCFFLAKKNSIELNIQQEKINQAEQKILQIEGVKKPELILKGSQFIRDTANDKFSQDGSDFKAYINQLLFDAGRTNKTIKLFKNNVLKEKYIYENISRLLEAEVIRAFYLIIQIDLDIKNIQDTFSLMRNRLFEIKERVRLGKSRESEVLMIESQMLLLQAQEKKYKGDFLKAVEALNFLINNTGSHFEVYDDLPQIEKVAPLDKFIDSVSNRSDIKAFKQDTEAQLYAVRIAKTYQLPSLNLDASLYAWRNGSLADVKWETNIFLDIPVFYRGIYKSRVNEEISLLHEKDKQTALIIRKAETEIKSLYIDLNASFEQASALRDAYSMAEKSYKLQIKDYNFGLVNNLDVIQAMLSMLDVKRSLDKSLIQIKIDKALLDIASQINS